MLITLGAIITALAAGWYAVFGLKSYTVTASDIQTRYSYTMSQPVTMQQQQPDRQNVTFSYTTFDGTTVNGHIRYPQQAADKITPLPVLIGVHAMGRSHNRWWQDSFKERPTVEQTHKITEMALDKGYAVIAIDARHHGERKDPEISVLDIIDNLHWWGKREPYEQMLIDTVRDHRVLLDWLEQQPQFDNERINIAGYSMGGQISLLLAAVDERINNVAAIVPPHINNKTAIVAPQNMLAGLADNQIWLLTANDDEYASKKQNRRFFNSLPGTDKQHFTFDSEHLLPADYVQTLQLWLSTAPNIRQNKSASTQKSG